MITIEAKCAACGAKIAAGDHKVDSKRLQTLVRNGLGVMRTDGLYAFYLYLQYRKKEGGELIWREIKALWSAPEGLGPLPGAARADDTQAVIALTENLENVLLARKLTERALVYALYGLRAG